MKITSEIKGYWVYILFDGIIHVMFKQASFIGLQVWIEAKDCFDIHVYLKEKTIHLSYTKKDVWIAVIDEIKKSV